MHFHLWIENKNGKYDGIGIRGNIGYQFEITKSDVRECWKGALSLVVKGYSSVSYQYEFVGKAASGTWWRLLNVKGDVDPHDVLIHSISNGTSTAPDGKLYDGEKYLALINGVGNDIILPCFKLENRRLTREMVIFHFDYVCDKLVRDEKVTSVPNIDDLMIGAGNQRFYIDGIKERIRRFGYDMKKAVSEIEVHCE